MRKNDFDIAAIVNEIGREVDEVLKSHKKEKYFEEIILIYSLIENVLKWSVFAKIFSEKLGRKELGLQELRKLNDFCRKLSFYSALNMSLCVKLIDFELYKEIDKVRNERNDVVHQLWMYGHRGNPAVLRKTLEMLAGVGKQVAMIAYGIAKEIGSEEIYKLEL